MSNSAEKLHAENGNTKILCKIQEFLNEFFGEFVVKSITRNTNLFEPTIHLTEEETQQFLVTSFIKYMKMETVTQPISHERWCEIKTNLRFDPDFVNGYSEVEYIFDITQKDFHC
ncbi:CRISPR-associated endoribonuclease Cas13a [Frankliniella fusca]|uniref:CRISPR-associated endoribonuclease Cas13a n=1 Tax=Frankliniella fusca TaxID=407009 RepID=A0AAE1I4C3_9NEOP|nr:CRISPR-associated endoribonuclease Cas13a [Frankliniella fusca]KAK3931906.1 CRISPR-associated endoribonuclease Cas13a [Frankliniella fusca]